MAGGISIAESDSGPLPLALDTSVIMFRSTPGSQHPHTHAPFCPLAAEETQFEDLWKGLEGSVCVVRPVRPAMSPQPLLQPNPSLLIFFWFGFFDTVSPYSSSWPQTFGSPPASACQIL